MRSAGLVPYRRLHGDLEILIAHPGGPFWARRQEGAWSVIKGEVADGEDPLAAALREFAEETGWDPGSIEPIALGEVTMKSGKVVTAWAFQTDFDPSSLSGETVTTEWRGRLVSFPEIDQVRWVARDEAERLLNPAQAVYYERLNSALTPDR